MTQLSSAEKEHYDRHLILDDIGLDGQLKLKKARVLVIGAGGLGCPVLQYLTAAGIGTIGVLDGDTVSVSNLQRQILYVVEDIGKAKAEVAVERLKKMNPHVNFQIHNYFLTTENALNLFDTYDIIVDGTDNFQTRYLCNDAAVLTNKPLVFGSIFKFEGQISVFNYKNGPTYRCLYPNPPEPDAVPNCSEIGVLGVLPGIIGTLMANEVLKLILNFGTVLSGKLLLFNALSLQQLIIEVSKTEQANITSLLDCYEVFCHIENNNTVTSLSLAEIEKLNKDLLFLDVKTAEEHKTEFIVSLNIPLQTIEQDYTKIPSDKTIIVFCKSGIRSKQAIFKLESLGFKGRLIHLKQ